MKIISGLGNVIKHPIRFFIIRPLSPITQVFRSSKNMVLLLKALAKGEDQGCYVNLICKNRTEQTAPNAAPRIDIGLKNKKIVFRYINSNGALIQDWSPLQLKPKIINKINAILIAKEGIINAYNEPALNRHLAGIIKKSTRNKEIPFRPEKLKPNKMRERLQNASRQRIRKAHNSHVFISWILLLFFVYLCCIAFLMTGVFSKLLIIWLSLVVLLMFISATHKAYMLRKREPVGFVLYLSLALHHPKLLFNWVMK